MEQLKLQAKVRNTSGKGPARRTRREGNIPAVMYKKGEPTISIAVRGESLYEALEKGRNTLINLTVEGQNGGEEHTVMIKDLQRDPIKSKVIHVDFIGIDLGVPLDVEVPLKLKGLAVGTKAGGILQQVLYSINVRCLPRNIPRELEVDVTELNLGESIHVKDVTMPEGAECIEDLEYTVASVVAPRVEAIAASAEEEEEEAAEAAEGEGAEAAASEKAEGEEKGEKSGEESS